MDKLCATLRRYELLRSTGFRKCGVCKEEHKEKPPPWWVGSLGEQHRKMRVLGFPRMRDFGSCGLCIPFRKARETQRAWHRSRWVVWHSRTSIRYASLTTMLTGPQPRCIAQRID